MPSFATWPHFSDEERAAVDSVLETGRVNYWTGQEGRLFEQEFAVFSRTEYAVAVANGTLALDLALQGLGIGARNGGQVTDEVVVTPRTFIASASAVVNAGAIPVFADVDAESQNITPATVSPNLTEQTRAIICVHMAGWPCDMDGFRELVENQDIKLIEDCAQAHGAQYKGRPVGGLGDVAAWSFCQDKIISTGGEGGMVTTNDHELWDRMWSFKDHGKSYNAVYNREHAPGFRWLHESIGTNFRLTEMQAAIGRIQLSYMDNWTIARNRNAALLAETMSPFRSVRVPRIASEDRHAYYKFYAFVRPDELADGWNRDRIVSEINAFGVPCMQGSCSEIYLEKAFDGAGCRPDPALPVAKQLGDTSLTFLVHPTLIEDDLKYAANVVETVLKQASVD